MLRVAPGMLEEEAKQRKDNQTKRREGRHKIQSLINPAVADSAKKEECLATDDVYKRYRRKRWNNGLVSPASGQAHANMQCVDIETDTSRDTLCIRGTSS